MGLLETIDQLNLDDDAKARLRNEHEAELKVEREEKAKLQARSKTDSVNAEITELSDLFGDELPGLCAYVRRVYMSDDEKPGLVLLSDHDLNLSGDLATGSTSREEISAAGVLRKFIELLPKQKDQEGKLRIQLSDMHLGAEEGEPPAKGEGGDEEEQRTQRRESASSWAPGGKVPERDRSRYDGQPRVKAGGGS